ncbi:hypothetical protein ACUNWD_05665 [Sunxiuqinia sp. A32]|uniref:hypothetical protein n=1 Tax=Sunxiuqinia sp. A32 TaxID=3461496 RepID=UPI004045D7FF
MNGISRYIIRFSFVLILLLALTPACKDDFNSSIPYVRVSMQINLIQYNDLTVPSNSLVFPAGYGGIIVTNNGFGFNACDAACPYEVDPQCKVVPDGGGTATCPCCGSQYLLLEGGSLLSGTGPSTEPLKPYSVQQSGSSLIVTN